MVLRGSPGRGLSERRARGDDAAAERRQPAAAITSPSCAPVRRRPRTRPTASARSWCRPSRSRPPISTRSTTVAARLRFEVVQSPRISRDETFAAIADGRAAAGAARSVPARHQRPDRRQPVLLPHAAPPRRLQPAALARSGHRLVQHEGGRRARRPARDGHADDGRVHRAAARPRPGAPWTFSGAAPHLVYFAAIGFGFMLVEISQLQRLTIFLGHPAYSLSVVLFSLLVSSGAGQPFHRARCRRRGGPRDETTAADHAGGARRLWHRHAGDHAPLRRRGHAGAHPDRRRHPAAGRLLPGDGVSPRHARSPCSARRQSRPGSGASTAPRRCARRCSPSSSRSARGYRRRSGWARLVIVAALVAAGTATTPSLQHPTPKGNREIQWRNQLQAELTDLLAVLLASA